MARGINKVAILGNLGSDPEARHTQHGAMIVNLNVATNSSSIVKSTGKVKESTEWHRITIFGKFAELAKKYLKKGSKVYIDGFLQSKEWVTKDGCRHKSVDIICTNLELLDKPIPIKPGYEAGFEKPLGPPDDFDHKDDIEYSEDYPF